MQSLQAVRFLTVRQRHGLPQVARAVTVEKSFQARTADLQEQIPQAKLDFMNGLTFAARLGEQFEDLRNGVLLQFHLEGTEGICNAHGWPPGGGLKFFQLQTYPQEADLATRAKTVTPNYSNTSTLAPRRLRPIGC